jgi:malonyl CoA-acyl carrier protein transacylase
MQASPAVVVGMACRFPEAPCLGKFWQSALAGVVRTDLDHDYDQSAYLSDCVKQLLSSLQDLPQTNNLLLAIGLDDLALAKLEHETNCNAVQSEKTGSTPEIIREAINALNRHRCDLALLAVAERRGGIALLALKRLEDAVACGNHIYAMIAGQPSVSQSAVSQSAVSQSAVSQSAVSQSSAVILFEASLRGLLTSILAVYHATVTHPRPRPWIVPSCDDEHAVVRTAMLFEQNTETSSVNSIRISQYVGETPRRLLTPRESEIFVMQSATLQQLLDKMRGWIQFINDCSGGYSSDCSEMSPVDLSYSMNLMLTAQRAEETENSSENAGSVSGGLRLAIVASSVSELRQRLLQTEAALVDGNALPQGVYYGSGDVPRKLAFMLPGLGSAYPDMLLDLCLHYPEVRKVFDYVEGLALAEGEKTLPSKLLFPVAATAGNSAGTANGATGNLAGTAMLATMDSAVVTVLLAEWAIYSLLSKFGINPDALIGCSTGEFAAFTMGGVVDITRAARMFYRLSVSVARSLPREQLLNLASIKVNAGINAITPILNRLCDGNTPLFVTAEFTRKHSIVTGSKQAVARAAELLRDSGIEFHYLPVAIPYHTPLVEGAVSTQHDEVMQIPLSPPAIPIWSCATAATYGCDIEAMRRTTTELFAKTILFERTIKEARASGIDTFIEVGPRDNLACFADEIFTAQDAKILRSDIMGRNSLTQLNNLLAELFCLGCNVDFSVLFENREVKRAAADLDAAVDIARKNKLSVQVQPAGMHEQVMISYLESLKSFHQQLMEVQTRVLNEYLASK